MSASFFQQAVEATRDTLSRLELTLRANPERFSVPQLNRALYLLLQNQLLIMGQLAEWEAERGQPSPSQASPPAAAGSSAPASEEAQGLEAVDDPQEGADPDELADADEVAGALEVFPVEAINRWVTSGTMLQVREERAFLNLGTMGEEQTRMAITGLQGMGFTRQVGILEAEGLAGRVVLFRKA